MWFSRQRSKSSRPDDVTFSKHDVMRPQLANGGHTGAKSKSAQWEIAFELNGIEVGALSVGVGDALALAVQPYMGGVAMLV